MLHADEECKYENQTKVMSLLEKVEVVDKSNRGMNIAAARYHYGVNECPIFLSRKMNARLRKPLWPVLHYLQILLF
jgi:hypothetical protein